MHIRDQLDAVYDTVPEAELTPFMDAVRRRAVRSTDMTAEKGRRVVEDLFIHEDTALDAEMLQSMGRTVGGALADYREDSLFTVHVPGADRPFRREFWRYRRDDGGSNGFKEIYRSPDGERIALVPKRGDDIRDRAERVMTWLHNTEQIGARGYALPARYVLSMAERDGEIVPALVGAYNTDMTLVEDMGEEEYTAVQPELAEAGQTISSLVQEGMVASSRVNDYYGPDTGLNLAYDFDADEVVVPELGELHGPAFGIDAIGAESRASFLERHGIDDRVDQYLHAHGLDGY